MSLARLLFASVAALFLATLLGVQAVYLANARFYLQEQLQSHAQDAATSLGISLAQPVAAGDLVHADLVMRAAFDRGYYQQISLVNADGRILLEKRLPPGAPRVPAWFVALVPLQAPSAESLISSGWRQLGRVEVSSHANFAYRQLWRTAVETTLLLAMAAAVGLALLALMLRALLSPLGQLERAANAVAQRRFGQPAPVPPWRELRSVAEAFNEMSAKIRTLLEDETARAERLQREAYRDSLTGLDNRRSFETRLQEMLDDPNLGSVALMLVELTGLKQHSHERGFHAADEVLRQAAERLQALDERRGGIRARLTGSTFALAFANVAEAEARALADRLCRSLGECLAEADASGLTVACGAVHVQGPLAYGALLSSADRALATAGQEAPGSFVLISQPTEPDAQGSNHWRGAIVEALDAGRLALAAQPVIAMRDGTVLQRELTARMADAGGHWLPAAQFIPMAARHGLTARLDRSLLELLAGLPPDGTPLAFNVSIHTLADPGFVDWLLGALRANPAFASRLTLEVAEFALDLDEARVLQFAERLRAAGGSLALDHFGLSRHAIRYLRTLMPAYVKLSASYADRLVEDRGNQFFVSSVVRIARPLEIRVYAQAVEQQETLSVLGELGVDGYQGYLAGKPSPYLGYCAAGPGA